MRCAVLDRIKKASYKTSSGFHYFSDMFFSVRSEPSRVMQIYKSSDLRFTVNNPQLACRAVKTLNLAFSVTLVYATCPGLGHYYTLIKI